MNLLAWSIIIAIIAAIVDATLGIKEPWKKLIYVGVLVVFIVGLILFLFPGILAPLR